MIVEILQSWAQCSLSHSLTHSPLSLSHTDTATDIRLRVKEIYCIILYKRKRLNKYSALCTHIHTHTTHTHTHTHTQTNKQKNQNDTAKKDTQRQITRETQTDRSKMRLATRQTDRDLAREGWQCGWPTQNQQERSTREQSLHTLTDTMVYSAPLLTQTEGPEGEGGIATSTGQRHYNTILGFQVNTIITLFLAFDKGGTLLWTNTCSGCTLLGLNKGGTSLWTSSQVKSTLLSLISYIIT